MDKDIILFRTTIEEYNEVIIPMLSRYKHENHFTIEGYESEIVAGIRICRTIDNTFSYLEVVATYKSYKLGLNEPIPFSVEALQQFLYDNIEGMKPEFKAVTMPCTQEQWENELRPALVRHGIEYGYISYFGICAYITNNYGNVKLISNIYLDKNRIYKDYLLSRFNLKEFIESCGVKYIESKESKETMKKYKNYDITATDVLRIHVMALSDWDFRVATDWLSKLPTGLLNITNNHTISYSENDIDEMFKAATSYQKRALLVDIFGEPRQSIDYSRIKTGSVVRLKGSGSAKYMVMMLNVPYYIHNNLLKIEIRNVLYNIFANTETGFIYNKICSQNGSVISKLENEIVEVISYGDEEKE